ncbi:MAG: amidohydrolase family protein [Ruminococcaceae bacterium]|nr:amidohydrolase family protein [Oscillospiraceae bacterium]
MQYPFPVIDSHTHIWTHDPEGRDYPDLRSLDTLRRYRELAGLLYVNTVCCPYVNHRKWHRDASQNILGAYLKLLDPRFFVFGGLVYERFPIARPIPPALALDTQARTLKEIGFDGMKMIETKPTAHKMFQFPPNSPEYDPYFEYLEDSETHLIWHVADPAQFWDSAKANQQMINAGWSYGDGTFASFEQIRGEVYEVLAHHPRLNVTFAHFLFMSEKPQELARMFRKYPNLHVDITPGTGMYLEFANDPTFWRAFFLEWQERILLGTDYFDWQTPEVGTDKIARLLRFLTTDEQFPYTQDILLTGLALPQDAAAKICGGNFLKATGGAPRPVDTRALARYIEQYLPYVRTETTRKAVEEIATKL